MKQLAAHTNQRGEAISYMTKKSQYVYFDDNFYCPCGGNVIQKKGVGGQLGSLHWYDDDGVGWHEVNEVFDPPTL